MFSEFTVRSSYTTLECICIRTGNVFVFATFVVETIAKRQHSPTSQSPLARHSPTLANTHWRLPNSDTHAPAPARGTQLTPLLAPAPALGVGACAVETSTARPGARPEHGRTDERSAAGGAVKDGPGGGDSGTMATIDPLQSNDHSIVLLNRL